MANTIKINPDRLREELKKRNLTFSTVGMEAGYSDAYISYCLKVAVISKPAAKALEILYHIPASAYSAEEPAKAEEKQEAVVDYEALYKCIYAAVYEAMKKALEG